MGRVQQPQDVGRHSQQETHTQRLHNTQFLVHRANHGKSQDRRYHSHCTENRHQIIVPVYPFTVIGTGRIRQTVCHLRQQTHNKRQNPVFISKELSDCFCQRNRLILFAFLHYLRSAVDRCRFLTLFIAKQQTERNDQRNHCSKFHPCALCSAKRIRNRNHRQHDGHSRDIACQGTVHAHLAALLGAVRPHNLQGCIRNCYGSIDY